MIASHKKKGPRGERGPSYVGIRCVYVNEGRSPCAAHYSGHNTISSPYIQRFLDCAVPGNSQLFAGLLVLGLCFLLKARNDVALVVRNSHYRTHTGSLNALFRGTCVATAAPRRCSGPILPFPRLLLLTWRKVLCLSRFRLPLAWRRLLSVSGFLLL